MYMYTALPKVWDVNLTEGGNEAPMWSIDSNNQQTKLQRGNKSDTVPVNLHSTWYTFGKIDMVVYTQEETIDTLQTALCGPVSHYDIGHFRHS